MQNKVQPVFRVCKVYLTRNQLATIFRTQAHVCFLSKTRDLVSKKSWLSLKWFICNVASSSVM